MKQALFALAATVALAAAPAAFADTSETGIVDLIGNVPDQCSVISSTTSGGAVPGGASFGDTVNLGTIAGANGELGGSISGSTADQLPTETFQINCTGANNQVTLVATPLATTGATPPAGYANSVNYTAEADFAVVGGGANPAVLSQSSTIATPASANLGAGVRLANSGSNNVTIKAYGFNTTNPTAILVAGTYNGQITVTISAGV